MKKLEDFAEDINKCSKCGLCQSVCPVYKVTGNDCAVSRGKFVMLEGVLKGDLKLNKNIEKYLDMCLKCGKCKDFCPSGIDVCKIFNVAKYECSKNSFRGKVERFFESDFVFGNLMRIARKLTHPFSRRSNLKAAQMSQKLLYFKGCVNKVFPKTDKALARLLKHHPVKIIEPDFECCGIPFYVRGDKESYTSYKKSFEKIVQKYEVKEIVTTCASCEKTLKGYNIGGLEVRSIFEYLRKKELKPVLKQKLKVQD